MTIPTPYALVLIVLAVARVTELITDDKITEGLRDRFVTWAARRDSDKLVYFITCPWCVGLWVSLAAWGLFLAWPEVTTWASVPLAVAMAASFFSSRA